MATHTCAVVLLLGFLFVVEGLVIKLEQTSSLPIFSDVTPNDPRCDQDGLFGIPGNCTSYYVCSDGSSQTRHCPEGFKFDTYRHCTPEEDADCSRQKAFPLGGVILRCTEDYGDFPYSLDCHDYLECIEGVPTVHSCPDGRLFQPRVGCVEGYQCPLPQAESWQCLRPDGSFPHPTNCKQYLECNNWYFETKDCPSCQAFDPDSGQCTYQAAVDCRNDVVRQME